MRQIKFRAWHNNAMEFSYLGFDIYDYVFGWMVQHDGSRNPKDFLFQQFTGLTDKNGVEIYEGDILRMENVYGEILAVVSFSCGKFIYTQKYSNKEMAFLSGNGNAYDLSFDINPYEVIGNIYQNPELLK